MLIARLRSSPRTVWLVTFVLIGALGTAWALSSPPFSAIDEATHVIKAVTATEGELVGDEVPADQLPDDPVFRNGWADFTMPEIYEDANRSSTCYRGVPQVPADCLDFSGPTTDARIGAPDSRYPPTYYLYVGGIGRLWHPGAIAVWLMRIATALLCAGLIASAAVSLLRLPAAPIALVGLAVVVTPMVLHMAGSVNPSGPEIAAAILLWSAGLVLIHEAREHVDRRLVLRVAFAACIIVLSRPLSPLFVGVIAVVLLALASGDALRNLVTSTAARIGAAVIVMATLFQAGWTVLVKPNYFGVPVPSTMSTGDIVRAAVGKTPDEYRQMIGVFGAPDLYAPNPTIILWTMLVGGLLFTALALGRRRHVLAAVVLLGLSITIPVIADTLEAHHLTFPWQGRYTMPLSLGVPLLAATAIALGEHGQLIRGRRLHIAVGATVVIAQFLAYADVLRRYTVGTDGPLTFWTDARWVPPLPVTVLLVGTFTALVAWAWWILSLGGAARGHPPDDHRSRTDEPASDVESTAALD